MCIKDQIEAARAHILHMKECAPHIYPEWSRLKRAEFLLKRAMQEVTEAQQAWDKLGTGR